MKAILFADRHGEELLPLTQEIAVALLPIATKPLIEHTLEDLLTAGIKQVLIIVSAHADQIEQTLGNGQRWGMQLEYFLSRGQEAPAEMLAQLGAKLTDSKYLLIRGDLLRSFDIKNFLTQAGSLPGGAVATIKGVNAGVCVWYRDDSAPSCSLSNVLHWPTLCLTKSLTLSTATHNDPAEFNTLAMEGNLALLDSLRAYHQANIDVLAGQFPVLVIPGYLITDNLRVGPRSSVKPGNLGLVGAYCQVHPQAFLLDKVVLGHEVIVGRQAILQNTVVLPHTYVGENVEIKNAIVRGNLLIRVDTGAIVQVIDSFLLADLKKETLSRHFSGIINRTLGLLTLLLSLPLWPLAVLSALLQNPRAPLLRKIKLRGNLIWRDSRGIAHPQNFMALELATNVRLLKHLPKLLAVISGQMRMVGVSPESPEQAQARTAPWQKVRDYAPIGLIGPSQLTIPANAPEEERLLLEAYYARTRHLGTDLIWLLRGILACFGERAWSNRE